MCPSAIPNWTNQHKSPEEDGWNRSKLIGRHEEGNEFLNLVWLRSKKLITGHYRVFEIPKRKQFEWIIPANSFPAWGYFLFQTTQRRPVAADLLRSVGIRCTQTPPKKEILPINPLHFSLTAKMCSHLADELLRWIKYVMCALYVSTF